MKTPICNAAAVAASTADADDHSDFYVRLDVARKLERERNEARHKLELCMAANSDVARIAKERDEARADAHNYKEGYLIYSLQAESAERERDEAREKCVKLQSIAERAVNLGLGGKTK
jgi:hypothetical protein